jgi:hypothetical protein
MRTAIMIVALTGALAGCGSSMTDKPGPVTNTTGPDITDPSDVTFGVAGIRALANLPPKERLAAMKSMKLDPNQRVQFAIAESELPGNSVAIVVRNSDPQASRILVIAGSHIGDEALELATRALVEDQTLSPVAKERRVLQVALNGEVRNVETKSLHVLAKPYGARKPSSTWIASLLEGASGSELMDLEGVGRVRLYRFE